MDLYRLQDPTKQYPRPRFPRQSQRVPGLAKKMSPQPDHGETSYRGSGRLPNRSGRKMHLGEFSFPDAGACKLAWLSGLDREGRPRKCFGSSIQGRIGFGRLPLLNTVPIDYCCPKMRTR